MQIDTGEDVNFIDILYENWLFLFILLVFVVVILTMVTVSFVVRSIGTRVILFKKNTASLQKAKEMQGATKIKSGKKIFIRDGDPFGIKLGIGLQRLYVCSDGMTHTLNIAKLIKLQNLLEESELADLDEDTRKEIMQMKVDWPSIFESEAIEQSVAGMMKSDKFDFVTLGAGAFLGAIGMYLLMYFTA